MCLVFTEEPVDSNIEFLCNTSSGFLGRYIATVDVLGHRPFGKAGPISKHLLTAATFAVDQFLDTIRNSCHE